MAVQLTLRRKRTRFYHAINLRDFEVYCERRALVSREQLLQRDGAYTPFYTDATDGERGLLSRVFGNLSDFGSLFWSREGMIPNAYGPITLVFNQTCWACAQDDVQLTRKGAAAPDYDINRDALNDEEVEALFDKRGNLLPKSRGVEASFDLPQLSFQHIAYLIVEPITIGDRSLLEVTRNASVDIGRLSRAQVKERTRPYADAAREATFADLVRWSLELGGNVPLAAALRDCVPEEVEPWLSKVSESLNGPLRQWLEYTYVGTLSRLQE